MARSIDKWAFTFGVLILTMTEFVLVKHPGSFWVYYMTVIPLLVFFRIPHYRSLKWEFFMLDFCESASVPSIALHQRQQQEDDHYVCVPVSDCGVSVVAVAVARRLLHPGMPSVALTRPWRQ